MNIKYVCPSYKRPNGVRILDYLKKVKVYVSEEEYEEYIKYNNKDNIVKIPKEYQGHGKGKCLNYILDLEWDDKTDAIVVMDDDIEGIYRWYCNKEDELLNEEDIYELIERNTLVAKEWGAGIWNISNDRGDRLRHNPTQPFNTKNVGSDAFMCFIKNDGLRYDERFLCSEGMDLQLQSIQKYHKLIRFNNYYMKVGQWKNNGGYQELRKKEKKIDNNGMLLMKKKWGNIIKINKKSKVDCAYTVQVPIDGI